MKTVAIIQARYGSSRLPGKVLKVLGGQTVLAHVLNRSHRIKGVDEVCCAVSEETESDSVAEEGKRNGAIVVRGSEKDVLERYYTAAKLTNADNIMRITSDCPVIDPEVCQLVIDEFESSGADYGCNNLPPSWPHGLDCEIFRFEWLEKAFVEARKPSEREHVTPFIRNHPDVKKINVPCPLENVESHRWTLDTQQDYDFFKLLFEKAGKKSCDMSWQDILGLMDDNLTSINAGQDRYEGLHKSLEEDKRAGF